MRCFGSKVTLFQCFKAKNVSYRWNDARDDENYDQFTKEEFDKLNASQKGKIGN